MQRSLTTILAFPKVSPNPYQTLLYQAVESENVIVRQGNIKEACLGHYDLVHFHWPETFFSLPTRLQRWWGFLKFTILVLVFKLRRKKFVWTMHNVRSHDERGTLLPSLFRLILFWATDAVIALSHASAQIMRAQYPALRDKPLLRSWHGDYRPHYPNPPTKMAAKQRAGMANNEFVIGFFGAIRPYKNVSHLIKVFQQVAGSSLADQPLKLTIAGWCLDETLRDELTALVHDDPRIQLTIGYAPESEIPWLIQRADLMVLPFLDILNSGSSLLALSFNGPILVPAKGSLTELAQTVGPEWVRTYPESLTSEILADAIVWAATPRPSPAPLESYGWQRCGKETAEFLHAIAFKQPQIIKTIPAQDGFV